MVQGDAEDGALEDGGREGGLQIGDGRALEEPERDESISTRFHSKEKKLFPTVCSV